FNITRRSPYADAVGLRGVVDDGYPIPGTRRARLYANDMRGNGPVSDTVEVTVLARPVILEVYADPAIESGSWDSPLSVLVRDAAGRRRVDQGLVELRVGSYARVSRLDQCATARFNGPI